ARTVLPALDAGMPVSPDQVVTIRCLNARQGVLGADGRVALVQVVVAPLPQNPAARPEPGREDAVVGIPAVREVELSRREESAVRGLVHRVEVGEKGLARAQLSLPLDLAHAVELEDQGAGVPAGIAGASPR